MCTEHVLRMQVYGSLLNALGRLYSEVARDENEMNNWADSVLPFKIPGPENRQLMQ